jgi:hypothetical protein
MRKAQSKPKLPTSVGFEPNAFYEKILELRRTNPAAFDSLSPVVKISLGAYQSARREHERLQAVRAEADAA